MTIEQYKQWRALGALFWAKIDSIAVATGEDNPSDCEYYSVEEEGGTIEAVGFNHGYHGEFDREVVRVTHKQFADPGFIGSLREAREVAVAKQRVAERRQRIGQQAARDAIAAYDAAKVKP